MAESFVASLEDWDVLVHDCVTLLPVVQALYAWLSSLRSQGSCNAILANENYHDGVISVILRSKASVTLTCMVVQGPDATLSSQSGPAKQIIVAKLKSALSWSQAMSRQTHSATHAVLPYLYSAALFR